MAISFPHQNLPLSANPPLFAKHKPDLLPSPGKRAKTVRPPLLQKKKTEASQQLPLTQLSFSPQPTDFPSQPAHPFPLPYCNSPSSPRRSASTETNPQHSSVVHTVNHSSAVHRFTGALCTVDPPVNNNPVAAAEDRRRGFVTCRRKINDPREREKPKESRFKRGRKNRNFACVFFFFCR